MPSGGGCGDGVMWEWGVCAAVPGTGHPRAGQSTRCRDSGSRSCSILVPSHPEHQPFRATTDLCSAQHRSCHHLVLAGFGFTSLRHHRANNRTDSPDLRVTGTCPHNWVLQRSHRAPAPAEQPALRCRRDPNAGAAGREDGSNTRHPESHPPSSGTHAETRAPTVGTGPASARSDRACGERRRHSDTLR